MESFCACPSFLAPVSGLVGEGRNEWLLSLGVDLLFLSMRVSDIPINKLKILVVSCSFLGCPQ